MGTLLLAGLGVLDQDVAVVADDNQVWAAGEDGGASLQAEGVLLFNANFVAALEPSDDSVRYSASLRRDWFGNVRLVVGN